MKLIIAVTADLHYPSTARKRLTGLVEDIRDAEAPDLVALGGDIGEVRQGLGNFMHCLSIFREVLGETPILVIVGNHDLWVHEDAAWNSLHLFNSLLPALTERYKCHWLETSNYIHGQLAVVGSYLHYDYSAKDTVGPTAGLSDEFFEQNRNKVLNDRFMKGLPSDREFAKQLGEAFRERLQQAQDDPNIKSIVVLTHVSCLEEQMSRNPHDYQWSIAAPYFGNLAHQDFIKGMSKVRYVISGHSHQPKKVSLPGLEIINLGSDYGKPAFEIIELNDV